MRLVGLVLALGLALGLFRAEAQQTGKVARIGFLSPSSPSDARGNPSDLAVLFDSLRVALRGRGYVEDQNIKIESRWAEGNYDRLPGLAADLVRLKVAVIVTYGTPASQAAKRATQFPSLWRRSLILSRADWCRAWRGLAVMSPASR
jgi:putative tryptophan/tyrosine transport system substrate-binding protein